MGLLDFFDPEPQVQQVATGSRLQKQVEKTLAPQLISDLQAPDLRSLLASQGAGEQAYRSAP